MKRSSFGHSAAGDRPRSGRARARAHRARGGRRPRGPSRSPAAVTAQAASRRDRRGRTCWLSSISARSPRATTSAMIARTASSTSAAASRLVARKARKRSGEIGGAAVEADRHEPVSGSERTRPGFGQRGLTFACSMTGTLKTRRWKRRQPRARGRPRAWLRHAAVALQPRHGPKVGELGLQALDLEPQRRPARERQRDDPAGRIAPRRIRPPAG